MKNNAVTKEIEEVSDNYQLLLRELAFRILQTSQVLRFAENIPEEERKNIEDKLRCANELIFVSSLRASNDITELYKISESAALITAHNDDIQAIASKYAPKVPHRVKPVKCNHSFGDKGTAIMDKLKKTLENAAPMVEELRQHKARENFHHLKKYHDKTFSV